jgi:hypothetical protein
MAKIDYEKYLIRKPNYEAFGGVKNRQSPTMTMMSSKQIPGVNYYMEPGWIYGIPEPNPSLHEHVHEFGEIVMHWGSNPEMPQVLGGEVEFYVAGQPVVFNTSTAFYLPPGTSHGPVTWKKFQSPHMQMAVMLGTGSAGEAWGASGISQAKKSGPKKILQMDYEQYVVRSPIREKGMEFVSGRSTPPLTLMSSLQVPGVNYHIQMAWMTGIFKSKTASQTMTHNYDEIVLHLGGDSANPENLGADLEFTLGGQKLNFTTTSSVFVPRGTSHGAVKCRSFRRPYLVIVIKCGIGSLNED